MSTSTLVMTQRLLIQPQDVQMLLHINEECPV